MGDSHKHLHAGLTGQLLNGGITLLPERLRVILIRQASDVPLLSTTAQNTHTLIRAGTYTKDYMDVSCFNHYCDYLQKMRYKCFPLQLIFQMLKVAIITNSLLDMRFLPPQYLEEPGEDIGGLAPNHEQPRVEFA